MSIVVKLLTKPGCTLCEKAVFVLKRIKTKYPSLELSKCDITRLPQYQQYLLEVPVILVNEHPACRMSIHELDITTRIEQLMN